ncbi:MAG TPA: trypsin-like peptidase domain-containing protein [Pyrinomonadaceae bacterium]|jgi:serine protease Do|nr:trypsin-like peptidase domain-containing protein [Pyrinomonadaceae bacterium]
MAIKENLGLLEKRIVQKLAVFILVLSVGLLTAGGFLGYLLAGRSAKATEAPESALTAEYLSASFAEVAKSVEPAVVNIDTKGKIPEVAVKPSQGDEKGDKELYDFLQKQFSPRPVYGVGSGFIVDPKGYILTNNHVISDSSRITVRLQNGEEYIGTVVGTDEETDLAVVKVNAGRDLPAVKLGDSNAVQVGDWVLAIGSPFGLAQSVTAGIISQLGRETPGGTVFRKFIQTDAAINKGNSGGPLVNMRGEVIGINSQIASVTGDFNGIGFALPSNEVAFVYQQILAEGKVKRGYLGVNLESIRPEFGKVYEMPDLKGAMVVNVQDKQSPAGKAGIQPGDIVTEIDGKPVIGSQDLISKIASIAPDRQVSLTYYREINAKLEKSSVMVKLGERPNTSLTTAETPDAPKKMTPGAADTKPWGLNVTELTPQAAVTSKWEGLKGVVVKGIDPASFLADVGDDNGQNMLLQGDLIQGVNRTPVKNIAEFTALVGKLKTGDAVVLQISRFDSRAQKAVSRLVQFTVQ